MTLDDGANFVTLRVMAQIKVEATIMAAGGVSKFSEAIGLTKTTVRYWLDEDRVPSWREAAFIKAARRLGIDPSKPPKPQKQVKAS